MFKRMLVGVSGGPSVDCKIRHAIEIARRHAARIDLLSVVDVDRLSNVGPVPIGGDAFAANWRDQRVRESHEHAETAIAKFVEAAAAEGIDTTHLRQEGDPFDALSRRWLYNDLCLLGLRDWFDHGIVPNPENALLRLIMRGVRPILAVPEEYRPVNKVMIAFDGSPEASKSMKMFGLLQPWGLTEIEILCVSEDDDAQVGLLEPAADYCKAHGFPTSTSQRAGDASDAGGVILEHARAIGADAIVIGSSYHRVLIHSVISSTTIGVLRSANVPVFTTH